MLRLIDTHSREGEIVHVLHRRDSHSVYGHVGHRRGRQSLATVPLHGFCDLTDAEPVATLKELGTPHCTIADSSLEIGITGLLRFQSAIVVSHDCAFHIPITKS